MRIDRVTMVGFGPYKTEQSVDFDAFVDDGIFLIGGRTGAGKSTILDAICFALYGSVPRYEGVSAAQTRLRSDHCAPEDPTRVSLEFTTGDTRYRVTRTPEYERPKARGTGTTTQQATAELYARDPFGAWVGLEAQLRTVGQRLGEIVQLSQDQFLQVILLAQNRFQQFLLAGNGERQALLRTLFGTRRFDDYDRALQERAKRLSEELGTRQGEVARIAAQFEELLAPSAGRPAAMPRTETPTAAEILARMDEGIAAVETELVSAVTAVTAADAAHEAARAEHTRLSAVRARQDRRIGARNRLEALQAAGAALAGEADAALAASAEHVGPVAALENAAAALGELSGSLAGAIAAERSLPQQERAITAARASRAGVEDDRAALRAEAAAGTARLAQIGPRRDEAVAAAADETAADEALRMLEPIARALDGLGAAQRELDASRARELAAGQQRTAASARLDALRAARLDGHAAELAAGLVDGDACPVCGSTRHPAPATRTAEPVTDDDIAAAEAALAEAEAAAAAHSRTAGDAAAALAQLRGAAAGRTEEQLAAERAAAVSRRDAAQQAARTAAALRAEHEELQARLAGHEEAMAALAVRAEQAAAQEAAAVRSRDEAAAVVAAALGGTATVAARAASVTAVLKRVREADARIRDHEQELAGVRAVLADPELQELPEQPAAVDDAAIVLREASAARDAARTAHTRAEGLLDSARRHHDAAQAAHAASAELADRVEVVRRLAATVHGQSPNTLQMPLESFVLAAELEEIVTAANSRLRQMSGGRYLLEHSDERAARAARSGLGLAIFDQHTGVARPTPSLSGGETFLASLALALGLAEVVTSRAGGITLDTLFIDEGFGSLDSETLEIAMGTLDSLRAGGRTIGLISHVEAMKERIAARLDVDVADGGWSVIRQ